jgi:adenylosuccinate lyase
MVERYAREEMKKLWTQEAKYNAWLEVEKAAVKAWNKLGLIPDEDAKKIIKNAKFDIKRIDEIEKETKHDVIPLNQRLHYGEKSRRRKSCCKP